MAILQDATPRDSGTTMDQEHPNAEREQTTEDGTAKGDHAMPLDPLKKRVQRRRKQGESLRQIAAATGASRSAVHRMVSGPKFKASLLRQQELIGLRKAGNEERLTEAIAKAAAGCLAALAAEDHGRAGVLARAAKDLAQACREQGESARLLLSRTLQEARHAGDPELIKARKMLEDKRHAQRAAGLVVEAAAIDTPRATHPADSNWPP
jgi:hypothetical protein